MFWRKSLFWTDYIACKFKPAVLELTIHVWFLWAPVNSQTHLQALIHPWLWVLAPCLSNTKGMLDDILLPELQRKQRVGLKAGRTVMYHLYLAGTHDTLLLIIDCSLYLQCNLLPVICTVTWAFLKHRYWHMYTHPHSITFMHTPPQRYQQGASSKTVKEAPHFCNALLQT